MATAPKPLQDNIAKGRCILFVGSGLSIAAGYPTWDRLVAELVDEAALASPVRGADLRAYASSSPDLLMVAEAARDVLGPHRYSNVLRRLLSQPVPIQPAHAFMASTNYHSIITTNYDKLIETAVTFTRQWAPPVYLYNSVSSLGSALSGERFFVFKLHGDIDSPGDIVLTDQDYDRMIFSSPYVRSFLQAIFLNYTLLFVGYGHSDPDFKLVLKEMKLVFGGYTPPHYALMPDPHDFVTDTFENSMNVHIIPYDSKNNHQEATDFLELLSNVFPYR